MRIPIPLVDICVNYSCTSLQLRNATEVHTSGLSRKSAYQAHCSTNTRIDRRTHVLPLEPLPFAFSIILQDRKIFKNEPRGHEVVSLQSSSTACCMRAFRSTTSPLPIYRPSESKVLLGPSQLESGTSTEQHAAFQVMMRNTSTAVCHYP